MNIQQVLTRMDAILWGAPLISLLLGTGIFLTFRLKLIQIFWLPSAMRMVFKPQKSDLNATADTESKGDISSFRALCVALSATVGTGNIVGVATAIKTGGPGAIFWMWIAAFFGMATKYAEGLLAIKYRSFDDKGEVCGGPMYYITSGMGPRYKFLANFFALACILVAFFGIGTFPQVNAIVESAEISFGIEKSTTDLLVTVLVAAITMGGLKSIAKIAGGLVPFMAILYVSISFFIILANISELWKAVSLILNYAFSESAAFGGFAGATVMIAIQNGIARGVFSNEAGLGSAPIAAATAKTKWPSEQGLVSMTGTFIDTIVICTMTGLVLVLTGVWCGNSAGAAMTSAAFCGVFGEIGGKILTFCLILFAFTTILGWNYYGERACIYLFGRKGIMPYRIIFIGLVASGAFLKLDTVWILADIVNGLMAIPNLVALVMLSGVVKGETERYFNSLRPNEA